MIRNILCFIGLHKWGALTFHTRSLFRCECEHCHKVDYSLTPYGIKNSEHRCPICEKLEERCGCPEC